MLHYVFKYPVFRNAERTREVRQQKSFQS